jgi:hypothetical protein
MQHYHSMETFAHFEIYDLQGNRAAEGHKVRYNLWVLSFGFEMTESRECISLFIYSTWCVRQTKINCNLTPIFMSSSGPKKPFYFERK